MNNSPKEEAPNISSSEFKKSDYKLIPKVNALDKSAYKKISKKVKIHNEEGNKDVSADDNKKSNDEQKTINNVAQTDINMESNIGHYIIVHPYRPMKLIRHKRFTIGRDESNDLVLQSLEVSRFHCAVEWQDNAYVLSDHNSSNGTFVNEDYIETHVLKDRDKIYIGAAIMEFREMIYGFSTQGDSKKDSLKETVRIGSGYPSLINASTNSFAGSIESIGGLTAIVQMLAMDSRTGKLKILEHNYEVGVVYFLEGRVVHTYYKAYFGNTSFFQIMRLKQGKFEFDFNFIPDQSSMKADVESLLLEFARLTDEENRTP